MYFWTEEELVAWDSFLDLVTHPLSSVLFLQTLSFQNQNSSQESCSYLANPTGHGSPLSNEKLWQQMDGGTWRMLYNLERAQELAME